jgi:two-component system sensor histidine kinase YesM
MRAGCAMTLKHKVFVYAVLLLVVCDGLSAGISFWVTKGLITNSIIDSKQNELVAIDQRVRDTFRVSRDKMGLLRDDPGFQQLVSQVRPEDLDYEQGNIRRLMQNYLKLKLYNMNELQSINIVVNGWIIGEGKLDSHKLILSVPELSDSSQSEIYAYMKDIYSEQPLLENHLIVSRMESGVYIVGVIDFGNMMQNQDMKMFILNSNNQFIYDHMGLLKNEEIQLVQQKQQEENVEKAITNILEGKYLSAQYSSTYSSLKYIQLLDEALIQSKFAKPFVTIITISIIIFILFSVILFMYSERLLKPISEFSTLLSGVNELTLNDEIDQYVRMQSLKPSMKKKLFLYYVICIIPMFIVINTSYFYFSNVVYSESKLNHYGTINEIRSNIEYRMRSYMMTMQYLSLDHQIQQELVAMSGPSSEQHSSKLSDLILNKGILGQNIQYIRFYDKEFKLVYSSDNKNSGAEEKEAPWQQALQDRLTQYKWFLSDSVSMEEQRMILFGKVKYLPQEEALTRVFSKIGYMEMSIKQIFLDNMIVSPSTSNKAIFILDEHKNILFSTQTPDYNSIGLQPLLEGAALQDSQSQTMEYSNQHQMMVIHRIQYTDWYLAYILPAGDLSQGNGTVLIYNLCVIAVMLVIALLLSQFLAKQILRPIDKLQRYMKNVDYSKNIQLVRSLGNNEFAILAHNFNDMLGRLRRLGDQIKEKEIEGLDLEKRKKEAQLTALQSQMNPHFLYNIFTSINMLVKGNQNDKASEMINATGKLLRFGLYRGDQIITVEEELEHVSAYIRVQGIRYKDRVQVIREWDDSIHQFRMPKFIIQPLVENVFEHASSRLKTLVLHIRIYIKDDHDLVIEIEDNGIGLNGEQLEALQLRLNRLEPSEHIGLQNVQERIQLFYGSSYGLTIESVKEQGTKVIVRLPISKE